MTEEVHGLSKLSNQCNQLCDQCNQPMWDWWQLCVVSANGWWELYFVMVCNSSCSARVNVVSKWPLVVNERKCMDRIRDSPIRVNYFWQIVWNFPHNQMLFHYMKRSEKVLLFQKNIKKSLWTFFFLMLLYLIWNSRMKMSETWHKFGCNFTTWKPCLNDSKALKQLWHCV